MVWKLSRTWGIPSKQKYSWMLFHKQPPNRLLYPPQPTGQQLQRPPVTCHGGREESFGFHGNHPLVVVFFVSFTVSPTKIDSNDKHMVCHSRVVGYMLVIFCACCIRSKAERNSCLKSPQVASSSCQMLTQWLPTCASRPGSHAQKICPPMQVQDSYQ